MEVGHPDSKIEAELSENPLEVEKKDLLMLNLSMESMGVELSLSRLPSKAMALINKIAKEISLNKIDLSESSSSFKKSIPFKGKSSKGR